MKRVILDAITVVCAVLYFWALFVICLVAEIVSRNGEPVDGPDDWPVTLVDNEPLNRQ